MANDLLLETLLDQPMTEEELSLVPGEKPQSTPEQSQENLDILDKLIEESTNKKVEQASKVSYSDVIKSGGLRAVAGPAQAVLALAEAAGAVDQGYTADFTKRILSMEKAGDLDLGQSLVRETLANAIPITAEIFATKGLSFLPALKRTAAIGGAGGVMQFVEDPNQAFATSSTRMVNGFLGGTLSPLFFTVGAAGGRLFSTLTGGRGEVRAVGPDIAPSQQVKEQGAQLIEEAGQKGITLTPGAATGDPALLAMEKGASTATDVVNRQLADIIGSNANSMDGIIDDLLTTIYPPKDGGAVVGQLFDQAIDDVVPAEPFYAVIKGSRIMKDLMSEIASDPTKAAAYGGYQPNSIGRVNYLRRLLQDRIDGAATQDRKQLINLKNTLDNMGRKYSSTFDEALKLSQRQKSSQEVMEALIRDGYDEPVPFRNAAESFAAGVKNRKVREKILFGIDSIADTAARTAAKEKFALIERLLPAVSKMEKTLTNTLDSADDVLARRSSPGAAGSWTIFELLNRNNNEKFIQFILDPNKSAARLRELLPKRNTNVEEFARGVSLWAAELLDPAQTLGVKPSPVTQKEEEYLKTSSVDNKVKAFEALSKAGKAEELQAKNPKLYDMLFNAFSSRNVA